MIFEPIAAIIVSFIGIEGLLAESVEYWIYNSLKIITLLVIVMFGVGYLRTYLPPEKIRDFLSGRRAITGYLMAALLGIISPFCSCSTIPIFLGLVGAGVPFGMTITFLATSPMVNTAALAIFPGLFGLQETVMYLFSGIAVGMTGGFILNKAGMDRYLKDFDFGAQNTDIEERSRRDRLEESYIETKELILEILPYVIIGVGMGALIHGYVPSEVIEEYLSGQLGVFGAVLAGVPMYVNILGVIPVVESLVGKGLPMGTGLAFMLSVAALSIPQFVILKKVMKKELLIAYGITLATGILILGLTFNIVV